MSDETRDLAEEIHKARTLVLPCPDNYDDDADAWCWPAARIVLDLGYARPDQRLARIEELVTRAEAGGSAMLPTALVREILKGAG